MPIYPPTTTYSLNVDGAAHLRAATLMAPVTTAFAAYLAAHPEVNGGPAVDASYIYFSAVTTGLSWWRSPALWSASQLGQDADVPNDGTFVPVSGVGVTTVTFPVADADVARAQAISDALRSGPAVTDVLGAALCTGLAMLSGIAAAQGPFN